MINVMYLIFGIIIIPELSIGELKESFDCSLIKEIWRILFYLLLYIFLLR